MQITFGNDFDQGYWPGPLRNKEASVGEIWLGQHGFLSLLETALGLRYPADPDAVRAAALLPALRAMDGFWSDSANVDPFGTARKLLTWRDCLRLHGWRGQAVSKRLAELSKVTANVLSGFPDRLEDISKSLETRRADISLINHVEDREQLPLIWRFVLDGLEKQGTIVRQLSRVESQSNGDLAQSRKEGFSPSGDGTLQLLRPAGPLGAAHEVAAWLSARDSLEGTVIIGPDPALDHALRRFGLPTSGHSGATGDNTLLQVLPLVLEMAWHPPNPQRALELLTLTVNPVPRGIANRLAKALQTWPAVDSDIWRETLAAGLDALQDQGRRRPVEDRLKVIFSSPVIRGNYPVEEVHCRVRILMDWARGRLSTSETTEYPAWQAILRQMENFTRLIDLSGLGELSSAQLRRAVQDATSEISLPPLMEAQAGPTVVDAPGCVVSPAPRIIWWGFTRESASRPVSMLLTIEERKGLTKQGAQIPDPGDEAIRLAERWRRPLFMAAENFIAVCPAMGIDGENLFPHPLWDEVSARASNGVELLENTVLKDTPQKYTKTAVTVPGKHEAWKAPEAIRKREKESASSLEKLISCPFRWVVAYLCGVWPGGAAALPSGAVLEGSLIHELIYRVFRRWPLEPDQAAAQAEKLFEAQGPRLAAPLFQPGSKTALADTRRALVNATGHITRLLSDAGLAPTAMEKDYETDVFELGIRLTGRPDLVAGQAVLDFKRSGATYWSNRITNGSAVQLACYGRLLANATKKGNFPPAGVFILQEARLITASAKVFSHADIIAGIDLVDTWNGIVDAVKQRRAELSNGKILAPGASQDCPSESCLSEEGLIMDPSCRFCDYAVLCGTALGG